MNRFIVLTLIAAITTASSTYAQWGVPKGYQEDSDLMLKRIPILTGYQDNPDSDAWYEQRQKMVPALGDRIFDMDFGRVFDSLVLAVSTLELDVSNMERASGYIQATGISLPPTEAKAMTREAMDAWCKDKGFDSSVLDREYNDKQGAWVTTEVSALGKKEKTPRKLTFQLVKMGADQTKVKLRFNGVYYPPEVEAYYKLVWQAVDKQIFVDKNIEGAVEERK